MATTLPALNAHDRRVSVARDSCPQKDRKHKPTINGDLFINSRGKKSSLILTHERKRSVDAKLHLGKLRHL